MLPIMIAAPHHLVSVAEYHRMIDAGVFAPGERIDLLDQVFRR